MSAGVFTVRSSMQHARTLATQAHARRALNVPTAATTTIATHDTKGTIRNVDAGCDFSGRAMTYTYVANAPSEMRIAAY